MALPETLEPSPMPAIGPSVPETDQRMPITPPLDRPLARSLRLTPMEIEMGMGMEADDESEDEELVSPRTITTWRRRAQRPEGLVLSPPPRYGYVPNGDVVAIIARSAAGLEGLGTPARLVESIDAVLGAEEEKGEEATPTQGSFLPTPRAGLCGPQLLHGNARVRVGCESGEGTVAVGVSSTAYDTRFAAAAAYVGVVGSRYESFEDSALGAGASASSAPSSRDTTAWPVPSLPSPPPKFSPMQLVPTAAMQLNDALMRPCGADGSGPRLEETWERAEADGSHVKRPLRRRTGTWRRRQSRFREMMGDGAESVGASECGGGSSGSSGYEGDDEM
ncbi:hypothetical protein LTR36_001584 [Oleoguttula mirabilis]|uniref:Uncharacterized protein n=1 Tax=Oleoguttula mirabilis TaxID=1507867 RepID=A0AAV9JMS8_9PEZI|nr:hypothetical protein LTR36_001584 [Oleoguttula mirabilis]